jgi:DNA-binding MarR family transcriptional regulator
MEVLGALVIAGAPVKPSDLAGWLSIERSTMSRNLALFEQRGLVDASDTSSTGRSLRVEITAAGTDAFARAKEAWSAAQKAVREAIGDEAASTLDTWLDNLARHAGGLRGGGSGAGRNAPARSGCDLRPNKDAGQDRSHDLADLVGFRCGAFPSGEEQVTGPDQRGGEGEKVGISRDPA